ncbi:MAG: metal-dependent hydrolase [Minisyncoccia bacterium]|jgi:membrane-bound metal-dependent hydrolase YbcI (DUF457 family)
MDVVSHILIGTVLGSASAASPGDIATITLFSLLPDLFQIPLYLRVGEEYHRYFWISHDKDWRGFRGHHPFWSDLWEIPHSLLFLVFIITPFVLYFHLPRMAIAAYFSHIFMDIWTHKGEWRMKPFYPFRWEINGLTNMWAWSWRKMLVSWAVLVALLMMVNRLII